MWLMYALSDSNEYNGSECFVYFCLFTVSKGVAAAWEVKYDAVVTYTAFFSSFRYSFIYSWLDKHLVKLFGHISNLSAA